MKTSPIAPLFETDAYKQSHIKLAIAGTTKSYSNFTNRSTMIEGVDHVVNFGLQAYIEEYVVDAFAPFFAADEDEVCRLYEERVKGYLGVAEVDTTHIRNLHRIGYLPLEFKQVAEGTMVPLKVPSFTIENTHPDFAWLTNYIETSISASIWHPSSVATLAAYQRNQLNKWADATGSDRAGVAFQWHDFSFRGMQSLDAAAASGAGHLTSFTGSDSLGAIEFIENNYPGDNGLILASIPATEHAVMSSGTAYESEEATYKRILTEGYPDGLVSIVSDTYSIWNVVEPGGILDNLRDIVLGRDGKLVVRPDSGNPVDIVCGTTREFGEGVASDEVGVIELLWRVFGGTVNDKGFKVLDSHLGVIYGDGITPARAEAMFERLAAKGFASENLVLGVGSYFYTQTRDSVGGSAIKMTQITVDGKDINILKDPITAKGKKSATGRLAVFKNEDGELYLVEKATPEQEAASELKTVWKDGQWVRRQSFADVRATLKADTDRMFG
jgi:nicotinamide phosphoribosyltransferase